MFVDKIKWLNGPIEAKKAELNDKVRQKLRKLFGKRAKAEDYLKDLAVGLLEATPSFADAQVHNYYHSHIFLAKDIRLVDQSQNQQKHVRRFLQDDKLESDELLEVFYTVQSDPEFYLQAGPILAKMTDLQ